MLKRRRFTFVALCNPVVMEDELQPEQMIDTPVDLRPDLGLYGIQEIDRGICEDTVANRAILRKNKLAWHPIYDNFGHPTTRIEVLSLAMQEGTALAGIDSRKSILEDPRDPNSDYQSGLDLLYNIDAPKLVPGWVLSATNAYEKIEEQRDAHPEKTIRPNLTAPPTRCRYIKADRMRCQLWSAGRSADDGLCRLHLGSAASTAGVGAVEKARQRVAQIAPRAVDVLEEMMTDAASEPVRLRAAEQILDRAGVRGGHDLDINVTVEHKPAAEEIRDRLDKLRAGADRARELAAAVESDTDTDNTSDMLVVDAEVVPDDE